MAHTPTSRQATDKHDGATTAIADNQPNAVELAMFHRLSKIIDPELGRSITDLGMITTIQATPRDAHPSTFDVTVHVELTVAGCPLSKTITSQINSAV